MILSHNPASLATAAELGYTVPDKLGFIHLDLSDAIKDYAGIVTNWSQKGIVAVNQLVGQLNRNDVGIPKRPLMTTVETYWKNGPSVKIRSAGRHRASE